MRKIVALLLVFVMMFTLCGCDSREYKKALSLYENGQYEEAHQIFTELGDYEDCQEMAINCVLEKCIGLINDAGNFSVLGSFEMYSEAFEIYYNLTPEHQARVTNADKLLAVEEEYKELAAYRETKALIDKIDNDIIRQAKIEAQRYLPSGVSFSDESITVNRDEANPALLSGGVFLDYSYKNTFGGTIEDYCIGTWEGTYEDEVFQLLGVEFEGLEIQKKLDALK